MLEVLLVCASLATLPIERSYAVSSAGDPKVFIYDWNGVSPAWFGKSVFQWSVTTGGYGE
jgi:hypothetical protein